MNYDVLVESGQDQSYTATVLGWPKLSVSGLTREEALAKLKATLEQRLAGAEIVTIEVDYPRERNPWIRLAGLFEDHPLFEELLEEMESDRNRLEAETPEPEDSP